MAVSAACAAMGCSAGATIKERGTAIKQVVKQAKEMGSERCMPRETAIAESNAQFALDESSEGNFLQSEKHIELARVNADAALNFAKANPSKCQLPKVVVKKPPVVKKVDLCAIDTDRDKIPDCEDKCPNDPGAIGFNGCPPPDRDRDGVPDHLDKCPDVPGLAMYEGCPDTDGDGIPDNLDKCPAVPGTAEFQGCPDTDGDRIADQDDKCPFEAGEPNLADPSRHGCKPYTLVVVKKGIIEIKEQVHFETGKAVIKDDSFELLRQVAQVMKDNPQFRIEVQGHTDSVGGKKTNQKLSEARARSVRDHLINRDGIAAERLTAVGYGMDKPIASNATAMGKAQNRRVEFHIISGQDAAGDRKIEAPVPVKVKPKPAPKKKAVPKPKPKPTPAEGA
jgi:outer membrane protein OmpA-like peptidoglycan-associated protein